MASDKLDEAAMAECRKAFEERTASRGISIEMEPDAWGRPRYKHPHVDSMWDGWQGAWSSRPRDSKPVESDTINATREAVLEMVEDDNKIANGLRDAIAYAHGDKSKAHMTTIYVSNAPKVAALIPTPQPRMAGDVGRRGKITPAERIVARCFGTTEGYAGLVQMINEAIEKAALPAARELSEQRAVEIMDNAYLDSEKQELATGGLKAMFRALSQHATITEKAK